ncbi:MAG: TIR domain-containing protein [Deltaproteobacteria bacterium]|nr:TIR domain-containing protein [Deltaproteobacteria bacterium]
MKQGLTVFICSTFADLVGEREAVLEAVRKLQLRHDSMEFFGARPGLPIDTCLEEVRRSHILVVVVGHRYGSLVPDLDISFSEAEYEEGFNLGKPCIVYMLDENVPVLPKNIERDPEKIRKLDRWKGLLQERHTVATFKDGHDLAVSVAADLARAIDTIEESEEVRTTPSKLKHSDINEILNEGEELGISRERALSIFRQSLRAVATLRSDLKPRVFLSHSHSDKELVREVADRLRADNIEVWIDEAQLKVGDSLIQTIEHGLDLSDFIVFFISNKSLNSQWSRKELSVALTRQLSGEGGAVLLPILLEDVELPPLLRSVAYLDLRDRNIEHASRLLINTIWNRWKPGHNVNAVENKFKSGNFRAYINLKFESMKDSVRTRKMLLGFPEVIEATFTYGSVDMVVVLAADELQRINAIVELLKRPAIQIVTQIGIK